MKKIHGKLNKYVNRNKSQLNREVASKSNSAEDKESPSLNWAWIYKIFLVVWGRARFCQSTALPASCRSADRGWWLVGRTAMNSIGCAALRTSCELAVIWWFDVYNPENVCLTSVAGPQWTNRKRGPWLSSLHSQLLRRFSFSLIRWCASLWLPLPAAALTEVRHGCKGTVWTCRFSLSRRLHCFSGENTVGTQ